MSAAGSRCLECDAALAEGDERVQTERGVFCSACFARLKEQVGHAVAAQSADIDFPRAIVGALLGGLAGAAVWWGVTVLTHMAFGLVAIVIGIAVGKGIVLFTGGKRAQSLQVLSVGVALLAYALGTYLTTRTFILEYVREQGRTIDLPLVPPTIQVFVDVVSAGFRPFDLVFLAIAVYEAWRIPAPLRLAARP